MQRLAVLVVLAGCDVVFRLDDLRGGTVDASIDAPPEVVAHYRFEQAGPRIADATGQHDGTVDGSGALVAVPGHEGMAVQFTSQAHVVVSDSPDWDLSIGSIDLWVRPAMGQGTLGIFSRDSSGSMQGHITFVQLGQSAFVVRLQQPSDADASSGVFLCSTSPIVSAWTHVVINLGAPMPELWIDGTLQQGTQTVDLFGEQRACGVNEPRALIGNNDPWVFGALGVRSTPGTTDNVGDPFDGGAIDELRILRVRQTF